MSNAISAKYAKQFIDDCENNRFDESRGYFTTSISDADFESYLPANLYAVYEKMTDEQKREFGTAFMDAMQERFEEQGIFHELFDEVLENDLNEENGILTIEE